MLIDSVNVTVDFNGIVIFTYPGIEEFFGDKIKSGANILRLFTETEAGDQIVDKGIVIPIIGLDDGDYLVRFHQNRVEPDSRRKVSFSDSGYVLLVETELFVADAAVFWDWEFMTGWKKVLIQPGRYAVTLEGAQLLDDSGEILDVTFDVILNRVDKIPFRTAKLRGDSRIVEH